MADFTTFDKYLKNNHNGKDSEQLASRQFAKLLDIEDPLAHLRDDFYVPKSRTLPKTDVNLIEKPDEESVYLCGNSLGLLPKATEEVMAVHMKKWAEMGVYGHFAEPIPWVTSEEQCLAQVSELVGAASVDEVGLMNSLTVNLHLLMTAFYKPTSTRHKILIEAKAFPSDHYAVESQIRLRGFRPEDSMICLQPREGEETLRTEDIIKRIKSEGSQIALVFFSSIQFYTGQFFEMEQITRAARAEGCMVGWDCAHSFANVPMSLHDWDVDFACWCTYKYCNTGAGGIGGLFVHSRHHFVLRDSPSALQGWWGHRLATRFQMTNQMELDEGARGFRLSCTPFMLSAAISGALKTFEKTSIGALRQKSILMTGYLEWLLKRRFANENLAPDAVRVKIITPRDPRQRGCQLSLKFNCDVKAIFGELMRRGVAVDVRYPNVVRVAPVHLYNSFEDCWRFVDRLAASVGAVAAAADADAAAVASGYY